MTQHHRAQRTYRRCFIGALGAAAIFITASPGTAQAEMVNPGDIGLGSAARVTDARLSEMHGKFISADSISYFGITLQTLWQTSDGVITSARMALEVNFVGGDPMPRVTVGWIRDGDPSLDVQSFSANAAPNYIAMGGGTGAQGLGSVNGAVQTNVIAGTDNRVGNAMSIAIVPATNLLSTAAGDSITGSRTDTAPDGDKIQFVLSQGQFGMAITDAQGGGSVSQGVNQNPGQLAQSVLLAGTANVISNVMNVTIGVDQLRAMNDARVDNALSAMRGHGF